MTSSPGRRPRGSSRTAAASRLGRRALGRGRRRSHGWWPSHEPRPLETPRSQRSLPVSPRPSRRWRLPPRARASGRPAARSRGERSISPAAPAPRGVRVLRESDPQSAARKLGSGAPVRAVVTPAVRGRSWRAARGGSGTRPDSVRTRRFPRCGRSAAAPRRGPSR